MVDVVEDFLEDKGITAEMLPNTDREEDPDGALIYGSDYDTLADEFARSLGIRIVDEQVDQASFLGNLLVFHKFCHTFTFLAAFCWSGCYTVVRTRPRKLDWS